MPPGVRLNIDPLPDGALDVARELAKDTAAIERLEQDLARIRLQRREHAARAYWSGLLGRRTIAELTTLSERQVSKYVRELEPEDTAQRNPGVVEQRQRRSGPVRRPCAETQREGA